MLLPRRHLTLVEPAVGDLRIAEERDELLGRTLLVATLVDPTMAQVRALLPALYQPTVLWMGPDGFTLGGYERFAEGNTVTDFAQTWWVRACDGVTRVAEPPLLRRARPPERRGLDPS